MNSSIVYRRVQPLLGTYVAIGVSQHAHSCSIERAVTDAFSIIEHIHQLMSFQLPNSVVSQLNNTNAGTFVPIPNHVAHVLKRAVQLCRQTDGLFNPNIAPVLVQIGVLPDMTGDYKSVNVGRLDECLTMYRNKEVCIHRRLVMDLSGIAKGYAVDLAVHCLRRAGVHSGIINAGGDLRVFGSYSTPIHIRKSHSEYEALGTLQQAAVATSGSYDGWNKRNEQNPLSPTCIVSASTQVQSTVPKVVTVVAPNCTIADALTKLVYLTQDVTLPLLKQYGAKAYIT